MIQRTSERIVSNHFLKQKELIDACALIDTLVKSLFFLTSYLCCKFRPRCNCPHHTILQIFCQVFTFRIVYFATSLRAHYGKVFFCWVIVLSVFAPNYFPWSIMFKNILLIREWTKWKFLFPVGATNSLYSRKMAICHLKKLKMQLNLSVMTLI